MKALDYSLHCLQVVGIVYSSHPSHVTSKSADLHTVTELIFGQLICQIKQKKALKELQTRHATP